MAAPNTYRASTLVKAARDWTNGKPTGQRRRFLALRSDGYILRRDSTYTRAGWKSPGWKLFRKKKEDAEWPAFARDFIARLSTYGYRVLLLAPGETLAAHGFSPKMRQELATLKHTKVTAQAHDDEDDRPAGTTTNITPQEKSRYRLWICPKCMQKVRAGTDELKVLCLNCQKAFVRKD